MLKRTERLFLIFYFTSMFAVGLNEDMPINDSFKPFSTFLKLGKFCTFFPYIV